MRARVAEISLYVCMHVWLHSPSESERRRVGIAVGDSVQSTLPRAARYLWAFLSMAGKSSWDAANASIRFLTEPRTCKRGYCGFERNTKL